MKALVVGAAGQVGGALMERVGSEACAGTYFETPFPGGFRFDLGSSDAATLIARTRPDVVFVAAGMTQVDRCESERDQAFRVNCDGPGALAAAARAGGARTVYFSTEYIFDGQDGPYSEEDEPHPISVYGESKLAGERAVLDADPAALILRTTVVFGPEEQGKNFVYRLAAHLHEGSEIRVPADQISSPTYNRDLASASVALVLQRATGIVNVVGPEIMSRSAFAERVARALDRDAAPIRAVATRSFGPGSAPRPLRAGLRVDRLTECGLGLRNVEMALRDWIDHPRGKALPV
ncbi:MAG: SDR family oxidoreductase [Planctomycetota bacterium]|jgi:dTDP-4-dehydrorhamnose reductase